MSTDLKPVTIRLIVPKTALSRVLAILGPGTKVETQDSILEAPRLTTAEIVRRIKEYAKLRDEISQIFRQTGIRREGKPAIANLSDLDAVTGKGQTELEDIRNKYQRMQSDTENLEREVEEVKKQISSLDQLSETGFSYEEMSSQLAGFRRILGRLPTKKLEAAQKALLALLKERTIVATGTKKQDWVYLLVASPIDVAPQTLQTLLLYDFISTDMPPMAGGNFAETVQSWRDRRDNLTKEIDQQRAKSELGHRDWADSLNRLADGIQETILTLRSVLRLGEGTSATYVFARLEKPPSQETVDSLAREGIFEAESY